MDCSFLQQSHDDDAMDNDNGNNFVPGRHYNRKTGEQARSPAGTHTHSVRVRELVSILYPA